MLAKYTCFTVDGNFFCSLLCVWLSVSVQTNHLKRIVSEVSCYVSIRMLNTKNTPYEDDPVMWYEKAAYTIHELI